MKRFVVCFDGTWQKLRQAKPTNISIIARSVAHTHTAPDGTKIPQIVIYSQGVGANTDALGKAGVLDGFQEELNHLLGGVFGQGVEDSIVETYLRLAFNYEAGDEIYVFGFSRGAFCARSFAGLIGSCGIVSRLHIDMAWDAFKLYRERPGAKASKQQRDEFDKKRHDFMRQYGKGSRGPNGERIPSQDAPHVTYLGIFDTVGQRGVPSALGGFAKKVNARFGFHDMLIGSNVLSARHAVAIDERRLGFPPTLWEGVEEANQRAHCTPGRKHYEQRWFVGTHGDIGGGEGSPLSAAPLKWVADGAAACGLRFYAKHGDDESPMEQALREAGQLFKARITKPRFWDQLQPMNYPIYTRRIWRNNRLAPPETLAADILDPSVLERAACADIKPKYKPAPLKPFKYIYPKPARAAKKAAAPKVAKPAKAPAKSAKAAAKGAKAAAHPPAE